MPAVDYKPELADTARELCERGATVRDLAEFFGVSERTIYRWQISHPAFGQALKLGRFDADERVERSLYHKATGYSFESEKVFQYEGQIMRTPTLEHVPPDTTAAIFWLKNRRPDDWRDKTEVEHSGSVSLIEKLNAAKERLKSSGE